MEQIVLNVNLKYVVTALNIEQRGRLLNAILSVDDDWLKDEMVADIYTYIKTLQDEIKSKKERMKELSLMAVAKRRLKLKEKELINDNNYNGECERNTEEETLDLFNQPTVNHDKLLRKEAKECNNINKYNLSSGPIKKSKHQKLGDSKFVPPKVEDVKKYINDLKLDVDAEEFVDFYESRGWCVGSSKIKNWQATVKLWHRRAKMNNVLVMSNSKDDEDYWHQMKEKVEANQTSNVEKNNI